MKIDETTKAFLNARLAEKTDATLLSRKSQPIESKVIGLGDLIAKVASPIARALHLPCIDPATKQLRPESPCAKRKARLNVAVPF